MADEEIDVLGDITLDNLGIQSCYDNSGLVSQSSELLNCDYTIHPQWLLDNTSANPACWYSNSNNELSSNFNDNILGTNDATVCSESNSIDQTGWSKQEKNLLDKGIEIFGKSSVRLAQFIGSKTSAEVKYYLKHHYCDIAEETVVVGEEANVVGDAEEIVLEEAEIPSSIEEIIAVVSTGQPTIEKTAHIESDVDVHTATSLNEYTSSLNTGRSLLKCNLLKNTQVKEVPFKKKQPQKRKPTVKVNESKVKFRVKTTIKKRQSSPTKSISNKRKLKEQFNIINSIPKTNIEIVTGNGTLLPMSSGEEVIKIKKVNSDSESNSDVNVDIEDEDVLVPHKPALQYSASCIPEIKLKENICKPVTFQTAPITTSEVKQTTVVEDLEGLSEELVAALSSTERPTKETVLEMNEITELEKYVHAEFFEGRVTKTPARYLKIRNHIINSWLSSKPSYITKTSIRNGLKNCGDVNCIGRIHQFLEQIGAINFGCCQTEYVRPLHAVLSPSCGGGGGGGGSGSQQQAREKAPKDATHAANRQTEARCEIARVRTKTPKYFNDGEGGCTLVHDENGHVIRSTVVSQEKQTKIRIPRKPSVKLIYCRHFSEAVPPPFAVTISFSTLLQMDLHAHSSLTEVMGLVGGTWDTRTRSLSITRYEPCKNIASSATHCDMCPVSQARAAESLHSDGVQVLGWFHSHPTFAPEPSQQDLDTQLSLQDWLCHAASWQPFVGIILSPYSLQGALIASPYRCLVVDKSVEDDVDVNDDESFGELNQQFGEGIPYKFKVDVNSSKLNVNELMAKSRKIFYFTRSFLSQQGDATAVDFNKPYFLDRSLTFMEKFICSVKMHLAKCSDINKMTCDAIIEGFNDICCQSTTT